MKKIVFAIEIFSLVALFPLYVFLELNSVKTKPGNDPLDTKERLEISNRQIAGNRWFQYGASATASAKKPVLQIKQAPVKSI